MVGTVFQPTKAGRRLARLVYFLMKNGLEKFGSQKGLSRMAGVLFVERTSNEDCGNF